MKARRITISMHGCGGRYWTEDEKLGYPSRPKSRNGRVSVKPYEGEHRILLVGLGGYLFQHLCNIMLFSSGGQWFVVLCQPLRMYH